MWPNTKIKNLWLWMSFLTCCSPTSAHPLNYRHNCRSIVWLHNANCPLFYIQSYKGPIYPDQRKIAVCHEPVQPARFQHIVANFWLNCPCLPVTQLNWAVAVTRDINEVVNFELTPFRVTDDVNMCYEFGELHTALRATEWPLTCITPPNLSWGEVNEAYWGEVH